MRYQIMHAGRGQETIIIITSHGLIVNWDAQDTWLNASQLKALCHDKELISSKIKLKWVQEVWVRPVSRYSAWEYAEIERVQRKDFVHDRVEKLKTFSYGQPKGKNTDEVRAIEMLEKLNVLQREPQRADLNTRRKLISCPPRSFLISVWLRAGSLVGNQPL